MNARLSTASWLCALCAITIACRSAPETPAEDPALVQARAVYAQKGARDALPLFETLLTRYEAERNARGAAIVVGLIGNAHKRLGNPQKAEELLLRALREKRAIADRKEEGRTLSHLGLLYWELADYRQANDYLNQSLAVARSVADREQEGASLNNLGLVADEQGAYARSTEHYTQAIALHQSTGFARGESDALGNLGGVHLMVGRYREAIEQYRRALAISERLQLKAGQSQDLGNLGLAHLRLGEVDEATALFDRALTLAQEAGLAKEEADWRKGRGSALLLRARHDEALAEYRRAAEVYERANLRRELVAAMLDMGRLLASVGDTAEAVRNFERAQALAESIGYAAGVKRAALALGDIDARRGQYGDARRRFQQALERATADGDRATVAAAGVSLALTAIAASEPDAAIRDAGAALAVARAIGARTTEAGARLALGDADRLRRRWASARAHFDEAATIADAVGDAELMWRIAFAAGRTREGEGDRDGALTSYLRAASIIEDVRNRLSGQRFRAGYLGDKHQVYAALVRVLLALGRPADAFAYAERLRAQSYFELIATGPARPTASRHRQAEADLSARIRRLQEALQEERERPMPRQRGDALASYSAELDAAERAYSALLDELRKSEPGQAAARALEVPSVADLQARLPAATALIEYVVADDDVTVFVVTPSSLQARAITVPRGDLTSRVELLRDLIGREGSDRWRKPAAGLYELLVAPIQRAGWLSGISELILVPHGVLHYVPFATLIDATRSSRVLVEDFSLTMMPAATALVGTRPPAVGARSLLAAAPARARLPHAREEAHRVAETAQAAHLLLVGEAATETAFKARAGGYRMLHLATHGFFNRVNPLLSGVDLEADADADGRMQVFEILGLTLNADLVTLSACETALGSGLSADLPPGEEFVGLTRAFLTAGSRSVLASLWSINDRATTPLMAAYYKHAQASRFGPALAATQRAVIAAGGRESHPYYWAPFVLVGGS